MRTLRIILTAMLTFMGIQLWAQDYSSKNFNYDFYIGTWKYETDNEQFILKTWKHINRIDKSLTVVWGVFKYVRDGVIVYDYLSSFKDEKQSPPLSFMIIEYLSLERNKALLSIDYIDPVTEYDTTTLPHESVLTVVSTNPAKLSWHIVPCYDDQRRRLDPGEVGFTIPSDMILTKVKE